MKRPRMTLTVKDGTSHELASAAVSRWDDLRIVEHIADSGNAVYLAGRGGERLILRLTDPNYRSYGQNLAEMEYILHLAAWGAGVSVPVASNAGAVVEEVEYDGRTMLASVFRYAAGEFVDERSVHWGEEFFREWGRSLGRLHEGSRTFRPTGLARRWHWTEEGLIADARSYIPVDDGKSLREFDAVMEGLARLPESNENFGMTHADFAPQNFRYHPERGITAFDFGNCCYHWFMSDIAISLSRFRRLPVETRNRYRSSILSGYREIRAIDPELLEHFSLFLRLRILYVYLSRLMKFGPHPTDEQGRILGAMRDDVHERFEW